MSEQRFYKDAYSKRGAQEICPGSGHSPSRRVLAPAGASAFERNTAKGICRTCGEAIVLNGKIVRGHLVGSRQ